LRDNIEEKKKRKCGNKRKKKKETLVENYWEDTWQNYCIGGGKESINRNIRRS